MLEKSPSWTKDDSLPDNDIIFEYNYSKMYTWFLLVPASADGCMCTRYTNKYKHVHVVILISQQGLTFRS